MRFIIDAHLPAKIAESFLALGHEVLHTRNLPKGNATSDSEIMDLAGLMVSLSLKMKTSTNPSSYMAGLQSWYM